MSYIEPTPIIFKGRFPEFAPVESSFLQMFIDDAISEVGECWLEKDRARAQMLLTAHNLSMEGEPSRSEAIADGDTGSDISASDTGTVKRERVGDVETEYNNDAKSSSAPLTSGKSSVRDGYLQTVYGKMFLKLMKRNVVTFMVV